MSSQRSGIRDDRYYDDIEYDNDSNDFCSRDRKSNSSHSSDSRKRKQIAMACDSDT